MSIKETIICVISLLVIIYAIICPVRFDANTMLKFEIVELERLFIGK